MIIILILCDLFISTYNANTIYLLYIDVCVHVLMPNNLKINLTTFILYNNDA